MCLAANARDSLLTLVRLARAESAALVADLADIGQAIKAAETSLAQLAQGDEAGDDPCPHRERASARRMSLFMTLDVLHKAAAETRAKLDAAVAETKKLQGLLAKDLLPEAADASFFAIPNAAALQPAMRLAS